MMFSSTPTGKLRFVSRDGRNILQQEWATDLYGPEPTPAERQAQTFRVGPIGMEFSWRDVPLVEE